MGEFCHILVVEDDVAIRDPLVDALLDEGYRVTAAANGAEAFRQLQRDARPCLMLLDLMMPVMTGWELLGHLRQHHDLASLPVVVLSAVARFQGERPGFADTSLLTKPVSIDALLTVVQQTCREHHHPKAKVAP